MKRIFRFWQTQNPARFNPVVGSPPKADELKAQTPAEG